MSRTVRFLSFVMGLAMLSACAATIDPGDPGNAKLLNGKWEGSHVSLGMDSVVYFDASVSLRISGGTGEFWQGNGLGIKWDTPVKIRSGKVVLKYGRSSFPEREFTLKKVDGKLRLVTEYNTTWQEWNRIDTISLTKKP